jgi:hypothetical protein
MTPPCAVRVIAPQGLSSTRLVSGHKRTRLEGTAVPRLESGTAMLLGPVKRGLWTVYWYCPSTLSGSCSVQLKVTVKLTG